MYGCTYNINSLPTAARCLCPGVWVRSRLLIPPISMWLIPSRWDTGPAPNMSPPLQVVFHGLPLESVSSGHRPGNWAASCTHQGSPAHRWEVDSLILAESMHTHTHMYTNTHAYTCVHTHIHACAHTHGSPGSPYTQLECVSQCHHTKYLIDSRRILRIHQHKKNDSI